jgi:hypothetical protein
VSGIHYLRSVSVPSGLLICRSSVWLSGPDIALGDSCLVCISGVPLHSDPLIVGTSTVLSPNAGPLSTRHYCHYRGVCKYPGPGTSVEHLSEYSTFRRQFRSSQLLHLSYPSLLSQLHFPSVVVVSLLINNWLSVPPSVISGLSNFPSCEINSLNGCPSLKHTKSLL